MTNGAGRRSIGIVLNGVTGRMGYRQHLVRSLSRSRIYEDDALGSELHDDVAARAADDVEVGPQLNDVKVAGLRLGGDPHREQQSNRDKPGKELHIIPRSTPTDCAASGRASAIVRAGFEWVARPESAQDY